MSKKQLLLVAALGPVTQLKLTLIERKVLLKNDKSIVFTYTLKDIIRHTDHTGDTAVQ